MRLLRLPRELGRFVWSFVSPRRTAGRVPLGRFLIVVQLAAALVFVGYTLTKKSIRLPGSSEPYQVEVVFADAKGLDQLDEPAAAVAGTPLGRVSDVRYEDGRSVATITFDPEVRGKVFADASAAIRPGSALQNLVVNVDPGSPEAGPLPDGEPIPNSRSEAFVAIDELTSVLDADTRAYAQILIAEAEGALAGREGELREALGELGRVADAASPVARALATRRRLLTRLVGHLDRVFAVLGTRGGQLTDAVEAGAATLEVTAAREAELAALLRELGPALSEAGRALRAVNGLTIPLLPALETLAPAAAPLAASLASTRELLPRADAIVASLERLVGEGRAPLELMLEGTTGIRRRLRAQVPVARDLAALVRRLDRFKGGLPQLADTISGALSVQDRGGAYGQVDVLAIEPPKPENFGLPASAARSRDGGPSTLERRLAAALEQSCRRGSTYACAVRAATPGLPGVPERGRGR